METKYILSWNQCFISFRKLIFYFINIDIFIFQYTDTLFYDKVKFCFYIRNKSVKSRKWNIDFLLFYDEARHWFTDDEYFA